MLGRLVLILLQLAGGWYGGILLLKYVPLSGALRVVAFVIIAAILVWLIGVVGAEILKNVERPSTAALATAVIVAAIAAALPLIPVVSTYLTGINTLYLPVVGAMIGYQISN